jgi:hypothetical protein
MLGLNQKQLGERFVAQERLSRRRAYSVGRGAACLLEYSREAAGQGSSSARLREPRQAWWCRMLAAWWRATPRTYTDHTPDPNAHARWPVTRQTTFRINHQTHNLVTTQGSEAQPAPHSTALQTPARPSPPSHDPGCHRSPGSTAPPNPHAHLATLHRTSRLPAPRPHPTRSRLGAQPRSPAPTPGHAPPPTTATSPPALCTSRRRCGAAAQPARGPACPVLRGVHGRVRGHGGSARRAGAAAAQAAEQ